MRPALVLCGLGLVGSAIGLALAPALLLPAWMVAGEGALGLGLGALIVLLIHQLSGGQWGEAAGPALRATAGTLPLTLLLLAPLLAAIPTILPFLHDAPDTLPEVVGNKLAYLQPGWIGLRTVLVALAWLAASALAGLLPLPRLFNPKAAPVVGLALIVVGATVFTTDWGQALEPSFKSTIYPLLVLSEGLLGALALATLLVPAGADPKGDFGKLLIGAILFWVYLAFMQWLIIWMGDLPDEVAWYLRRTAGPWAAVLVLGCLSFAALPFLLLLLHRVRTTPVLAKGTSVVILVGFVLTTVWRLAPAYGATPAFLILLASTHLAIGGAFALALRPSPRPTAEARHV